MDTRTCVETLIEAGDIPADSEVVSTNNKVVTISPSERIVARIGSLVHSKVRDDPHDLHYSHTAAWLAGATSPVVRPLQEKPIVSGDYVISNYPLLNNEITLNKSHAEQLYVMTTGLGNALSIVDAGMSLRHLNVPSYVQDRLDYMQDNHAHNPKLVEYICEELDRMHQQYPFGQLVSSDKALIHGDFKADNVVADSEGRLQAIDLDAVAVGPRFYDLASWRLRCEIGDEAPLEEVANAGRRTDNWNEEAYRALIGWKAISSMSFTLRYEDPDVSKEKVNQFATSAIALGGLDTSPPNVSV